MDKKLKIIYPDEHGVIHRSVLDFFLGGSSAPTSTEAVIDVCPP
jgi:hypothetical protein